MYSLCALRVVIIVIIITVDVVVVWLSVYQSSVAFSDSMPRFDFGVHSVLFCASLFDSSVLFFLPLFCCSKRLFHQFVVPSNSECYNSTSRMYPFTMQSYVYRSTFAYNAKHILSLSLSLACARSRNILFNLFRIQRLIDSNQCVKIFVFCVFEQR